MKKRGTSKHEQARENEVAVQWVITWGQTKGANVGLSLSRARRAMWCDAGGGWETGVEVGRDDGGRSVGGGRCTDVRHGGFGHLPCMLECQLAFVYLARLADCTCDKSHSTRTERHCSSLTQLLGMGTRGGKRKNESPGLGALPFCFVIAFFTSPSQPPC